MSKAQVIVERLPSEKDWTLSEFFINGVKHGVGVEDEYRAEKLKGETRIPNGIYELGLRHSPKFSKSYYRDTNGYLSPIQDTRFAALHELIWVKNVPNFEYVLWHWGNTDNDTDGCYIVGSAFAPIKGERGVSGSRIKYTQVYPILFHLIKMAQAGGPPVFVEYRDKVLAA